jgi:hypothetical protein
MSNESDDKISSLLADAINALAEDSRANRTDVGYVNINIRPTARQAAMLETIATIKGKNPTSMMAKDVSIALADFISESKDFIPVIEEAFKRTDRIPSGALFVLASRNAIAPDWEEVTPHKTRHPADSNEVLMALPDPLNALLVGTTNDNEKK